MRTPTIAVICAGALVLGLGAGWVLFHGGGSAATTASATAAATGKAGETLYTCSMHPEVIRSEPGNCPQCGMKLVPLKVGGGSSSAGAQSGGKKARKILHWAAPMDPTYIRDEPGKSPMGMDLVPVYEDDVSAGPEVRIDPVTEQNMGIRTAVVRRGALVHDVRAVGTVTYDESKLGVVTLKVGGTIERLLVDQTGAVVHKGDPLFEMYAPEVVQAQDEYLRTKANAESATGEAQARWQALLVQSRTKLLRWDLDEEQIADLEQRGHADKTLTWRSPFDGVVIHKNAVEGAYVKPGETLYRIADLSTVWVYASIYEFEFPWVKVGQEARVELPYSRGHAFHGVVDYVYPYLDPKTRDRKVRIVFENPGRDLVPDMYATVHIAAQLGDDALLVPSEAVIDTGLRQIAFVARGDGHFDPRAVRVGVVAKNGFRHVLAGLSEHERVVTSGQFLLDSESRLQEAIEKMMEARSREAAGENAAGEKTGGEKTGGEVVLGATPGATPGEPAFSAPTGLVVVVPPRCPVEGGNPDPQIYADLDGHRFFFCCDACPERFLADPLPYIEKLRAMGMKLDLPNTKGAPHSGR